MSFLNVLTNPEQNANIYPIDIYCHYKNIIHTGENMTELSTFQYELLYNTFSFGIATFAAATIFFWLGRSQVSSAYKTAISITGLVTFIAFYHYWRIFESFGDAYTLTDGMVEATGASFNDAYRYVDWLLTVPLLLIELILVMKLTKSETVSKSFNLGLAAAIMVILGYPGEISMEAGTRWTYWVLAMIPFVYIVYQLYVGLGEAISKQPDNVKGLVATARNVTVLSWCFYPVVFIFPMIGIEGSNAYTAIQVGYTVADIVAKAAFGVLIFMIAKGKSDAEA